MHLFEAVTIVAVLLVILSFAIAHRDKTFAQFNLFDLLMENDRLSKLAVVFFGAFFVHTWILVRLTLDGKMDQGYLTFYGITWAAPIIAKMFSTAQSQPSTTTTTTTTGAPQSTTTSVGRNTDGS